MKCPVCNDVRMREVEKDGVMIDVCPDCKGVWLDRGELDKLMQGVRSLQSDYDNMAQRFYGNSGQVPPSSPNTAGHYGGQPSGYGQPSAGYGNIPPSSKGHYGQGHHNSGHGGYGSHGSHGYPYKKKKTMFDVLGDLFD